MSDKDQKNTCGNFYHFLAKIIKYETNVLFYISLKNLFEIDIGLATFEYGIYQTFKPPKKKKKEEEMAETNIQTCQPRDWIR